MTKDLSHLGVCKGPRGMVKLLCFWLTNTGCHGFSHDVLINLLISNHYFVHTFLSPWELLIILSREVASAIPRLRFLSWLACLCAGLSRRCPLTSGRIGASLSKMKSETIIILFYYNSSLNTQGITFLTLKKKSEKKFKKKKSGGRCFSMN